RAFVAVGVVALACAPGFVASVAFRGGYALSYYGELVGGLRGAVARGYERTYYDVADQALARWLDENARGSRVHFEPNHKEHERRWSTYPALKAEIETLTPIDEKSIDDVPLYTVYRR